MTEYFDPQKLINSTTIIYGPTKTGKTTLIIDLLETLRHYIPVCFIVSGTEDVKPAYSRYMDKAFICLDPKKIPDLIPILWEFQKQ